LAAEFAPVVPGEASSAASRTASRFVERRYRNVCQRSNA
jgi:hypothetical protein